MKQNILKVIVISGIVLAGLLFNVSNAKAKNCHSVYGGGEVCEMGDISIDKKVWNPNKNEWWDNIDSNDYAFKPGEEVKFELKVKNISDIKVNETIIRDILPDKYISYISSSEGGKLYDTRRVDFVEGDLDPDEVKIYNVTIKVKGGNEVPAGITCLTNKGEAYADTDNSQDIDTAMFCIINGEGEKKVLGVSYPTTGPNTMMALGLEILGFGGLGGAYLYASKRKVQ